MNWKLNVGGEHTIKVYECVLLYYKVNIYIGIREREMTSSTHGDVLLLSFLASERMQTTGTASSSSVSRLIFF